MPHVIDVHHLPGIKTEIAAAEHIRDIDVQGPYAVDYSKYWLNEETGKLFCYCEAPTAEAAIEVHRLAHGDPAENLIEVTPELLELFLGTAGFVETMGAVMLSAGDREHDTATRTILFTDIVGSTALTQRLGDEDPNSRRHCFGRTGRKERRPLRRDGATRRTVVRPRRPVADRRLGRGRRSLLGQAASL